MDSESGGDVCARVKAAWDCRQCLIYMIVRLLLHVIVLKCHKLGTINIITMYKIRVLTCHWVDSVCR